MVNYQEFNSRIQALGADIASLTDRLTANSQEIERLKPEVEQAASDLFSAKKAYALDPSIGNKKAVSDIQKSVTKLQASIEDLEILQVALQEKKAGIEAELKSTTDALRLAEVEELASHAQKFVDEYEKAIRAAHRAAVYLQTIQGAVQTRKEMDQLRIRCAAAFSLMWLPRDSFNLPEFKNGYPVSLRDDQYNRKQIIQELLFGTPESTTVVDKAPSEMA